MIVRAMNDVPIQFTNGDETIVHPYNFFFARFDILHYNSLHEFGCGASPVLKKEYFQQHEQVQRREMHRQRRSGDVSTRGRKRIHLDRAFPVCSFRLMLDPANGNVRQYYFNIIPLRLTRRNKRPLAWPGQLFVK